MSSEPSIVNETAANSTKRIACVVVLVLTTIITLINTKAKVIW